MQHKTLQKFAFATPILLPFNYTFESNFCMWCSNLQDCVLNRNFIFCPYFSQIEYHKVI